MLNWITYKWYRALKVLFGSRSFVKQYHDRKTYILIKGDIPDDTINQWIQDGYVEEWPIQRSNHGNPSEAA